MWSGLCNSFGFVPHITMGFCPNANWTPRALCGYTGNGKNSRKGRGLLPVKHLACIFSERSSFRDQSVTDSHVILSRKPLSEMANFFVLLVLATGIYLFVIYAQSNKLRSSFWSFIYGLSWLTNVKHGRNRRWLLHPMHSAGSFVEPWTLRHPLKVAK